MLIECLQKRDEPLVLVSLDRFVYRFKPRPDVTGSTAIMVCDVNSQSHAEHLLSLTDFREFKVIEKVVPDKARAPKAKARPRKKKLRTKTLP